MNELNVGKYDPDTDTIEIEGTKYAGMLFRELGCSFPNMVGQVLRIDQKKDKTVTVTRLDRGREQTGHGKGSMVVFSPELNKSFIVTKRFVCMDLFMPQADGSIGGALESDLRELAPFLWKPCEEFKHEE